MAIAGERRMGAVRGIGAIAAIMAAAMLTAATPIASAADDGTLCAAGEARYFSCRIGAKRVSVCGSAAGPVYRSGVRGRVEFTSRNLSLAGRGFSGGGEMQITAAEGTYTYTVFERTVRTAFGADGRNDPAFSSGLVVRRGGRMVSRRECADEAGIAGAAYKDLPEGGFVEH